jgi:hypothetical protein
VNRRNYGIRPSRASWRGITKLQPTRRLRSRIDNGKRHLNEPRLARPGIPNCSALSKAAPVGLRRARKIWTGLLTPRCKSSTSLLLASVIADLVFVQVIPVFRAPLIDRSSPLHPSSGADSRQNGIRRPGLPPFNDRYPTAII